MKSYWGLYKFGEFKFGELISVAFINQKNRTNTTGHLLLEITLLNRTLYLSDQYITIGANRYEGLVQDWGGIDKSRANESGFGKVGDSNIKLLNAKMNFQKDSKFSDLFSDYYFENRPARILQWFEGLGYSDCEIIFDGLINSYEFNESDVTLRLVDDDAEIFRIPFEIITKKSYPNAPDDSIGKPVPIVYGDMQNLDYETELFGPSPMILVDQSTMKFMICDKKVHGFYYAALWGYLAFYKHVPELNNYIFLNAPSKSIHNDTDGAWVELNSDITGQITLNLKIAGSKNTVSDISNLVDNKADTYIEITDSDTLSLKAGSIPNLGKIREGSGAADSIQIGLRYGPTNPTSGTVGTVRYYNKNYDDGAGGYGTSSNIPGTANTKDELTFDKTGDKAGHGVADDQSDQYVQWTWDELGDYEWIIQPASGCTIRIYSIFLRFNNFDIVWHDQPIVSRVRK